ncbi:BGTF surface domain-containing protein [Halosegnis longus]|uniref:BGTF surface domain-containing protein n=1 Tax=Halosegnis longus TaxID=2216012 RepID=UPI00096A9C0A|nr:BGTF surface domain-containing protein [Salella cibi]
MTDTNTKVRSLILTALMVVSVFGGSIAFAGAAAAANTNVDSASISASPNSVGNSATHEVLFTPTNDIDVQTYSIDYTGTGVDVSNVGTEDIVAFGEDTNNDGLIDEDYTDSGSNAGGVNSVNINNGEEVVIDTSSSQTVTGTVILQFSDAVNPSSTGDYSVNIALDPSTPDAEADRTLTITSTDTSDQASRTTDGETTPADGDTAGPVVFQGQTVVATGYDSGETVNLRRGTPGESNSFVEQYTADSAGKVDIDTGDLSTANYFTVDEDGDASTGTYPGTAEFEVAQQTLTTAVDPAAFDTDETQSELTVDTNRGGNFDIIVSSDDLSNSELDTLYGGLDSMMDVDDDGEDEVVLQDASDGLAENLDVSNLEAGTYNITHDVADTTATDDIMFDVSEAGEGTAAFASSAVSEERGDVLEFTVNLDNTDSAFVTVGGSDVNYEVDLTVTDGNGDGEVTVQLDTSEAAYYGGSGSVTVNNEQGAYSAAPVESGDDDSVTVENVDAPTDRLDTPLAAVDYDLSVALSENGNEEDVAVFSLNERSTDAAATWIAPKGTTYSDGLEDVTAAVSDRSTVALEDHVIVQVEASGIYSYINEQSDFGTNGVSLTAMQTDTTANTAANEFNAGDAAAIVFDADNDTFYAVFNTASNNIEAGDDYEVTFEVNENNPYIANADATETVTTTFTVEEREASFDVNSDEQVQVEAASGQAISGETNVAPGTELTIRARASGDSPFLKTADATVQSDGTFSGTFDFSGVSENTTFATTVPNLITESVEGVVGGATDTSTPTPTPEPATDTPTPTPEPATDTPTATPTPEPATDTPTEGGDDATETSGSQPGFGGAVAIVALAGAALIALRRNN